MYIISKTEKEYFKVELFDSLLFPTYTLHPLKRTGMKKIVTTDGSVTVYVQHQGLFRKKWIAEDDIVKEEVVIGF